MWEHDHGSSTLWTALHDNICKFSFQAIDRVVEIFKLLFLTTCQQLSFKQVHNLTVLCLCHQHLWWDISKLEIKLHQPLNRSEFTWYEWTVSAVTNPYTSVPPVHLALHHTLATAQQHPTVAGLCRWILRFWRRGQWLMLHLLWLITVNTPVPSPSLLVLSHWDLVLKGSLSSSQTHCLCSLVLSSRTVFCALLCGENKKNAIFCSFL